MNTLPSLCRGVRHRDLICGLHVTMEEGRLHAHLLDVAENTGPALGDHLAAMCRDIRDAFAPEAALSDISWRMTAGIEDSVFRIKEKSGMVTRIDFDHAFKVFHRPPIAVYQAAFADEDGFDAAITSGYGFMGGSPVTIVPVTLPHKNNDIQFFRNTGAAETVVIADSKRLLAAWKAQTPLLQDTLRALKLDEAGVRATKWGSGYDAVLLSSPLQDSLAHIFKNSVGSPLAMAAVSYDPEHGLSFSNGRHRLFNAINAGAPFVPVEVSGSVGERTAFRSAFEWGRAGGGSGQAPLPQAQTPQADSSQSGGLGRLLSVARRTLGLE